MPLISGAELKIIDIFARAYDFTPIIYKHPSFDVMREKVSFIVFGLHNGIKIISEITNRFQQRNVKSALEKG